MISFESAFEFVLRNEGGVVENPNDAGGITKYGISFRFLKSLGDKYDFNKNGILRDDIINLTLDQAKLIYHDEFWVHAPFASLPNSIISDYVFDCCVHHGLSDGVRILQRAIWSAMRKYHYVVDDGIMGAKTLSAASLAMGVLPYCLMAERAGFCRVEVIRRAANQEFLRGWLERCYRI